MYAIRSYYGDRPLQASLSASFYIPPGDDPFGTGILDDLNFVITSYSIHYTKLYEELYSATEAQACADACDQVGILDGKGTDRPDDYPAVDGIDRMLFTNTDPFLQAPLWIAVPPATGDQDFTSVSFTNIWSRPSISDNGSVAVFVSDEFNIHAVSLVGNPNERNNFV